MAGTPSSLLVRSPGKEGGGWVPGSAHQQCVQTSLMLCAVEWLLVFGYHDF